jgi:hypothetical protein
MYKQAQREREKGTECGSHLVGLLSGSWVGGLTAWWFGGFVGWWVGGLAG